MLFYCSIHPEWDCFGAFGYTDAHRRISQLLETIALSHFRNTGECFTQLERLGIILGNGAFQTILIQQDPFAAFDPMDRTWAESVSRAAAQCLEVPLCYGLSIGGRLYLLCCYPRLSEGSPEAAQVTQSIGEMCRALLALLRPAAPALRILASDLQFGDAGIFRSFNDLSHAMEYYDFRTACASPVILNSELQLHGALISDLSVYRQLSVVIAEQLARSPFSAEAAADQICDVLMSNTVPSMESVHYHVQVFMLTLTDYLGSTGLVDAAYMSRHHIVYRSMAFEREQELRRNTAVILEELHRQNRTLQTIGRQNRIRSVREYVEGHISDPDLTAAQLSERFGIGTAQLSKQFRYYYGVSLHRFIQQVRFRYAEELLRLHSDWPMHQVATAAGYSDLSTMYRAFRNLGGITPGALRDALRQKHE